MVARGGSLLLILVILGPFSILSDAIMLPSRQNVKAFGKNRSSAWTQQEVRYL